jgi:hypothetical protein
MTNKLDRPSMPTLIKPHVDTIKLHNLPLNHHIMMPAHPIMMPAQYPYSLQRIHLHNPQPQIIFMKPYIQSYVQPVVRSNITQMQPIYNQPYITDSNEYNTPMHLTLV